MRRGLLLASPFIVIAAGNLVARTTNAYAGHARWIPVSVTVWVAMLLFTSVGTDAPLRRSWFQASGGNAMWRALALFAALAPIPIFIRYAGVLASPYVWVPWIVFGAINPFVEEMYWRGSVLSAASLWPRWIAVLYVSAVFALSHPAIFGVISAANRTPQVTASTFVMGVIWSVVFLRTRSLRWPVFSHLLVDLLALSVPAFLNLFVPLLRY